MTSDPCDWPVIRCGDIPCEGDKGYDDLKEASTEVLWSLSGERFGCCEATVMPCRWKQPWWDDRTHPWWTVSLVDGVWVNYFCREHGRGCDCTAASELYLPGNVCEVVSVSEQGDPVPTGSYRVDNNAWLVRTDGGRWPDCNDGSLAVTYRRGEPVPKGGQRALGELMSELHAACSDDGNCKLPKRLQVIARQGVTLAVRDTMEFFERGKTGLYFCDLWLSSVNPKAHQRGAKVVSPDAPAGRSQTWPD